MTSTTTVCMEEWPSEHRGGGYQPEPGTTPVTLQVDHAESAWSHRKLFPTPVIDKMRETKIYEDHRPSEEESANLQLDRDGNRDYLLSSMTSMNLDNSKAPKPIYPDENTYDWPDESHEDPPRPRENISLVPQNLIESQSRAKMASVEHLILSRRSSKSEMLSTSQSSSTSESLPLPRPPPGPGPGPSQRPIVQISEPDEGFRAHNQSLQRPSRNGHPQRRESGDDIREKLKALRAEVWGLRSKLYDQRNVLREKGHAKAVADDKFFKFIRSHGFATLTGIRNSTKEQETLANLYEDCEALRDEYGPLEDDYNLLENFLNNREYEMQKLEERLAERQTESSQIHPETESLRSSPPSNYSGSEFSQEFHPLVAEYYSKIGDVKIFSERLEWHIEEKLSLEDEKQTKERVNTKLADLDQKWLDNYPEAEAALRKELEKAEAEAEELHLRCYALGLIDEEGDPLDLERQERQTFVADEVDAGGEKSDFVKFPLLLPYPGNKKIQLQDQTPIPDDEEEDIHERINPSDRINGWLLQKLRSSPLDVNLLARTFESLFGHIGERWQIEVLEFWYKDGSNEKATEYRRSLSEVPTQSPRKTGYQAISLSGRSLRRSMGILFRSSTLRPLEPGEEPVVEVQEYGLVIPPSPGKDLVRSV